MPLRAQGVIDQVRREQRHPGARGLIQGSVVVLKNRDGSILAESGGRQIYHGRSTSYSDFNRVRLSMRQPGSAMKPIVYLAAFRHGDFTLETLVPDEPISVPTGRASPPKWISNYDGRFKGLIPIRQALAESRNAVAIWITAQIGIDAVLQTSHSLGVQTPLQRYATTALGASEYSVQLSGNTSYISTPGKLLPRRNLQVVQPPIVCASHESVARAVPARTFTPAHTPPSRATRSAAAGRRG